LGQASVPKTVTSRWRGVLVSASGAGAGFSVDLTGGAAAAGEGGADCASAGSDGTTGIVRASTSIRVARIGLYSTISIISLTAFSPQAKPWSRLPLGKWWPGVAPA
jgi:hypothetical protein